MNNIIRKPTQKTYGPGNYVPRTPPPNLSLRTNLYPFRSMNSPSTMSASPA